MRRKKNEPTWILASASPRRKTILDRLGIQFLVDPSGIPEPDRKPGEKPSLYAIRIARLKAGETAGRHKSGLILAADTVVLLGNKILGKPKDKSDARLMLGSLSGRWHEVVSGVCVLDQKKQRVLSTFSSTRVRFRRISAAEIEWYLKSEEYRDKAGAYGVQGKASIFIDRIDGCFFNVVGFPVAAFAELCRKHGINLLRE